MCMRTSIYEQTAVHKNIKSATVRIPPAGSATIALSSSKFILQNPLELSIMIKTNNIPNLTLWYVENPRIH